MQALGERLRSTREYKGVTASEAASATRIMVQHITALENEDFDKIAAPVYVKGFLKLYAEYLELNPDEIVEQYKSSHVPLSPSQIAGSLKEEENEKSSVIDSIRKISKTRQKSEGEEEKGSRTDFSQILGPIRSTFSKIDISPKMIRHGLTILGALLVLLLLISTIGNCARRGGKDNLKKSSDQSLIEGIPEPYIEPEMMPRS